MVDVDRARAAVAELIGAGPEAARLSVADLRRFADAAMAALSAPTAGTWVQFGVRPQPGRAHEMYAALAQLADELLALSAIENFFFMHKPPGLRVRFELGDGAPALEDLVARWRRDGIAAEVTPSRYEPEQLLFGGPASMPYVHRLFTVDAVAWLVFHRESQAGPAWAYSLALLRHLYAGLGVVGWEDLDVWDRIGRQTGRVLPDSLSEQKVSQVAEVFRAAWLEPDRLPLAAPAARLVEHWGPALAAAAGDWLRGYFEAPGAMIGPREGAAFFTIFHWNRGGLSGAVQALVTAALSDRAVRP